MKDRSHASDLIDQASNFLESPKRVSEVTIIIAKTFYAVNQNEITKRLFP